MRYEKGDTRYIHLHQPSERKGCSTPLLHKRIVSTHDPQPNATYAQDQHEREQGTKVQSSDLHRRRHSRDGLQNVSAECSRYVSIYTYLTDGGIIEREADAK